jgi:cysteine-rich repeat protein
VQVWCRSEGGFLCGNGALDDGESCDDGNTADGDGCSSKCQTEQGFKCTHVDGADPPEICKDIDECADTVKPKCQGAHQKCYNAPGSFACECETGFAVLPPILACQRCSDHHKDSGACAHGTSCTAILFDNPKSVSGVFTIGGAGAGTQRMYCDMTRDNGTTPFHLSYSMSDFVLDCPSNFLNFLFSVVNFPSFLNFPRSVCWCVCAVSRRMGTCVQNSRRFIDEDNQILLSGHSHRQKGQAGIAPLCQNLRCRDPRRMHRAVPRRPRGIETRSPVLCVR